MNRSGFVVLAISIVTAVLPGHSQVTLELHLPNQGEVGAAVPLRIAFANRGSSATYVQFSGVDYGDNSLIVCARKDGQWYRTGNVHFDRNVESGRFDFVPLKEDQTFTSPLIAINDSSAGDLPVLLLPEAGTYEIFATYMSIGSPSVGVLWPIWRGIATSPVETITLSRPSEETLGAMRGKLLACTSNSGDCDSASIAYFRVVKDAAAAKTLIPLLDKSSVPDSLLLTAVANQGGDAAQGAMGRFTTRFPTYADVVARLLARNDSVTLCADRSVQGAEASGNLSRRK